MAISSGVEDSYYTLRDESYAASSVVELRDGAKRYADDGDLSAASRAASDSVIMARGAQQIDPRFSRELYASLGMKARFDIALNLGVSALSAAREMEEIDLDQFGEKKGIDQYEIIFRPAIAAAMHIGGLRDRLHGVRLSLGGMVISLLAESERLVSFPNRNRGRAWRFSKKAQFAGRNALALGANVLDSDRLAKLAVK